MVRACRLLVTGGRPAWFYFIFFKYLSTDLRKSSAIGAPVFADSLLSFASSSSGSHMVVRFFIIGILRRMSVYVNAIAVKN